MQLTRDQEKALSDAAEWWRSGDDRPFLIQGYAGTGKTTTIETIVSELTNKRPAYMAFTNKAARVLSSKVRNSIYCGTIHSAIYFIIWHEAYEGALLKYEDLKEAIKACRDNPAQQKQLLEEKHRMIESREVWSEWGLQDGFAWDRSFEGGAPVYDNTDDGGLIVVDECSMVRSDIGQDLLSLAYDTGYRVIAVGDPGQLPPVVGKDYKGNPADVSFFTPTRCVCAPVLTEVMRQASDSNIIKAATWARCGHSRLPWSGGFDSLAVLDRSAAVDPSAYDQVICGRHLTRRNVNATTRQRLGRSGPPQPGDKMIFNKSKKSAGVINGDTFVVDKYDQATGVLSYRLDYKPDEICDIVVNQPDYDDERELVSYAYAVTCHKSQGSEYGTVLLHNEAFCFRDDAHKWLYTGITRAKNFVTVIQ